MKISDSEKSPSSFVDAALESVAESGDSEAERQSARERWAVPVPPFSVDIPVYDFRSEPFSRFFRSSASAQWDYCIRGARRQSHPVFLAALRVAREIATTAEEHDWESPMCSSEDVERRFLFLDGGFYSRFGTVMEPRGAWVWGRKAIRLLCYELNIAQRKRWKGETVIPDRDQLLSQTKRFVMRSE